MPPPPPPSRSPGSSGGRRGSPPAPEEFGASFPKSSRQRQLTQQVWCYSLERIRTLKEAVGLWRGEASDTRLQGLTMGRTPPPPAVP